VIATTRERVMEAVQALGYTPDFGGRALASRRTNTVGAIIPTMENAIFARGLQSFQEALTRASARRCWWRASGYSIRRANASRWKLMASRGADGLLLIGSARPEASVEYLRRRGVPYSRGLEPWRAGRLFRRLRQCAPPPRN
jgi:LacI family transcriptional regulator